MQVAKVAYIVLAHSAHEQLLRLLRTLRKGSPAAAIVLHFDAKHQAPAPKLLDDLAVHMVEPRIPVLWGNISQVDAMLAALEFTSANVDFEWLTFISGQDYPLRPLDQIEADMQMAECDAFVRAGPAGEYLYRYELRYWNLPRFRHSYLLPDLIRSRFTSIRVKLNAAQRFVYFAGGVRGAPSSIGIRAIRTPFNASFRCFKGSQWMTLNRRATSHLLQFNREHPEVLNHYRRTLVPDESYLQSILWNSQSLRVRDDHRRFLLWNEHKISHPITLTMQHYKAIVSSGKDFGRKFDMATDHAVLDALDRVVFGDNSEH